MERKRDGHRMVNGVCTRCQATEKEVAESSRPCGDGLLVQGEKATEHAGRKPRRKPG
jgi:ribosomal protein L40E